MSPPGAEVILDSKEYLYFAGTGYFGLQGHPDLLVAGCDSLMQYGIGTATTRGGYGTNPALQDVEQIAARFFGTEDSVYYVSGYCGNAIMVEVLEDKFDICIVDEIAHYSVYDAARMTGKKLVQFRHCDAEDLKRVLKAEVKPSQRPMVLSDGMFAMSGHIPPIPEYLKAIESYDDAIICLDDAHAIGVLGENGRGTFEYFGVEGDHLYSSGTLSKAIGGHGGIIAGSKELTGHIRKRCHVYRGASAPPTPAAAMSAAALKFVMKHPELREQLRSNVRFLRKGFQSIGLDVEDSPAPIISIVLESSEAMRDVYAGLLERGIAIAYVDSYAGVGENGCLRIAVFATHTEEMLNKLLESFSELL